MRVALLTNFVPPYRVPFLQALAARVDALRVLVSTPMEANRAWTPAWGDVDVVVQRTLSWRRRDPHPDGFEDVLTQHIPLDTLPRLAAFRPDVVVSGELGARTAQALLYGMATGTPVLVWANLSERTEAGRGPARERLRRWILPRASGVVVHGASAERYVIAHGAAPRRVFRHPQSPPVGALAELPLARAEADARRLLLVGQLIERKGVLPFLGALGQVAAARPERAIALDVVGDGPQRAAVKACPTPPNLSIRLHGNIPYERLPEPYGRAGIFALPTLADEWAFVVNEALAAGLPVLGSVHSQAAVELVEDGVHGWLFDPDAPGATRAALERALDTPTDALARMRAAARERGAAYTPEGLAGFMADAIEAVAAERGRTAAHG
ncbi:MAG TPA: glycosyltransferase family 4 protein [Longimicrobiales bacterium]|nr:glycosyltransferase family 4 protein [Longimicrobiales bacterium]